MHGTPMGVADAGSHVVPSHEWCSLDYKHAHAATAATAPSAARKALLRARLHPQPAIRAVELPARIASQPAELAPGAARLYVAIIVFGRHSAMCAELHGAGGRQPSLGWSLTHVLGR